MGEALNRLRCFPLLVAASLWSSYALANDRACYNPKFPDAVIKACTQLINSGKLKGAALSTAYNNRGLAHNHKADYDRAIQDLSEAIRLDPNNSSAFNNRGMAYNYKNDYDRAIIEFGIAIRLDPGKFSAFNNRAFSYSNKREHDRAIADASEAIRLNPKNAFAYKNRAASYEGKGELEKALADFQAALRIGFGSSPNKIAEREAIDGGRRIEEKLAASKLAAVKPAAPKPVASQPQEHTPPPAAAAPAVQSEIRVALVIGNGRYRHAGALANPANDAADIAAALRRIGFEVVEGADLDRRAMEDKVREFSRKLDRADLALFYYAGHGLQVSGRNYLLPVDSKLERPGDLTFEAMDMSQVLAQMEAEQRVNLVFLDACRDNPLSRSLARSMGTRSSTVGTGLAQIHSALGTMIGFATQPDAVALDGDGRNSPFTTAMLKHLSTPALDIAVLMRRVRADVVSATRGKQVPWDHSSLIGEVVLAR